MIESLGRLSHLMDEDELKREDIKKSNRRARAPGGGLVARLREKDPSSMRFRACTRKPESGRERSKGVREEERTGSSKCQRRRKRRRDTLENQSVEKGGNDLILKRLMGRGG